VVVLVLMAAKPIKRLRTESREGPDVCTALRMEMDAVEDQIVKLEALSKLRRAKTSHYRKAIQQYEARLIRLRKAYKEACL